MVTKLGFRVSFAVCEVCWPGAWVKCLESLEVRVLLELTWFDSRIGSSRITGAW